MNRSWKISTNQKSSLSGAIESGTNPRSASTESKSRTNRVDAARFPDKFILSVLPMPRFTMPSVERSNSNWETRRASVLVCGKNSSSFFLSSLFSFSFFFFFSVTRRRVRRDRKKGKRRQRWEETEVSGRIWNAEVTGEKTSVTFIYFLERKGKPDVAGSRFY